LSAAAMRWNVDPATGKRLARAADLIERNISP